MRTLERPSVARSAFVLPQHLEIRDRYHEAFLDECLNALSPYGWGVARLQIEPKGLAGGVFRVTELVARFPSGEIAELPRGARPLERILPPGAFPESPGDVWLGLPDAVDDGPNVGSGDDLATRYERRTSNDDAGVPTLLPRLRLYLDGAEALPTDRIRLARLRSAAGGVEVDPDFLPPSLWPLEGTFLPAALSSVAATLSDRRGQLLATRRDRPHEPLTFRPEQVPELIALSVVEQALAALTHPTSERGVPPWEAHRILSELLGAIESIEGEVGLLPPYDHDAPGPSFRALVERLLGAIPRFARPPHESFPFTRKDAHTFELRIPDVARIRKPLYLVMVGADRGSLEQGVPAYAKLASDMWMDRIRQTATRGIELAPVFDPPASFPSSEHSACFLLNTRSEYCADALERRSLLLYLPNAAPSLTAALYVTTGRPNAQ